MTVELREIKIRLAFDRLVELTGPELAEVNRRLRDPGHDGTSGVREPRRPVPVAPTGEAPLECCGRGESECDCPELPA